MKFVILELPFIKLIIIENTNTLLRSTMRASRTKTKTSVIYKAAAESTLCFSGDAQG